MPQVEVEESQLLGLQNTARIVQALMKHPEARALVNQAQKIVTPDIVIPEIDAAKPVLDRLTKTEEAMANFLKKQEEDSAKRAEDDKIAKFTAGWDAQKARVRQEYSYFNEEAIEAIEKMCTERGIADFEAGAALFAKANPPPSVEGSQSGGIFGVIDDNNADQAGLKKFIDAQMEARGEDDRALESYVREIVTETRGRRAA